jgi:predicted RNase H-like HicB family nuclease
MSAYFGILEKDADSLWGVWFPDLPGCTAAGATDQEATLNAAAALRDWIETADAGEEIPPASPIEALLGREDVRAAQDSRVAVVRVPVLARRRVPTRVNVSLDAGILEAIDDAARATGMTRSGFLTVAAEEKLARLG